MVGGADRRIGWRGQGKIISRIFHHHVETGGVEHGIVVHEGQVIIDLRNNERFVSILVRSLFHQFDQVQREIRVTAETVPGFAVQFLFADELRQDIYPKRCEVAGCMRIVAADIVLLLHNIVQNLPGDR